MVTTVERVEAQAVKVMVLPGNRVDRANTARALNRAPKTLADWKSRGIGPRCYIVGGRAFYDWGEIQAFMLKPDNDQGEL